MTSFPRFAREKKAPDFSRNLSEQLKDTFLESVLIILNTTKRNKNLLQFTVKKCSFPQYNFYFRSIFQQNSAENVFQHSVEPNVVFCDTERRMLSFVRGFCGKCFAGEARQGGAKRRFCLEEAGFVGLTSANVLQKVHFSSFGPSFVSYFNHCFCCIFNFH